MGELERMDPLLVAVEQAGAALVRALQDAINAAPPDQWANGVRHLLGEAIDAARKAGQGPQRVRRDLAEHDRPKGPMVTVSVSTRMDSTVTRLDELALITSGAFVMHNGDRYSRTTGKRIGWTDRWASAPYITEEERARVLALKWKPPSAAKAGKTV